jgi:penicillin-binding protein 1C
LRWDLDGTAFGPADGADNWLPAPGRHELKLVGEGGRALAAVRFEVRGALR